MIVFVIFSRGKRKAQKIVLEEVRSEDIVTLLDMLGDNYTLEITEEIDGKSNTLYYYRDDKIELYEGSLLGEDGVMVYGGKSYIIYKEEFDKIKEINKLKLHNYKGDNSFIKDPYYNIELLKKVINYCEMTPVNVVKANCKFNLSNYLDEYNILYNKRVETNYDDKISMDIVHYSDGIGKIIIDYTEINKVINNSESTIKYGIKIETVGENDFSDLLNLFSKTLNK